MTECLVRVYIDHGHKRLSTDFYQDKARKFIKFHNHFLIRFADVFQRIPQYATEHYNALSYNHAILKNRKTALKYWKLYTTVSKNSIGSLKLLYHIIMGK